MKMTLEPTRSKQFQDFAINEFVIVYIYRNKNTVN